MIISLIGIVRAMNYGCWVLEKSCKQMHTFVHKVNGGEKVVGEKMYVFLRIIAKLWTKLLQIS